MGMAIHLIMFELEIKRQLYLMDLVILVLLNPLKLDGMLEKVVLHQKQLLKLQVLYAAWKLDQEKALMFLQRSSQNMNRSIRIILIFLKKREIKLI